MDDGFFHPQSERCRPWTLISRLILFVLIAMTAFGLGRYSSAHEVKDQNRSPIGRGMTPVPFLRFLCTHSN